MNQLYPIVRRVRRGLLPVESVPVATVVNSEQPTANAEHSTPVSPSLVTSAATEEKSSDAKPIAKRNKR